MTPLRVGVLLPHFGSQADRDTVLDAARLVEAERFDGAWARDHVLYHPHAHEDQNNSFIDPFVTLAAAAALTTRIRLGFATLIPYRHPIQTATLLGSLRRIAGPGRVVAGWGVGSTQTEFDALGMAGIDRRRLVREQVDIVRRLCAGGLVSYAGEFYSFTDVSVGPATGPIPTWYGGPSPAAVRRAVEYCDGWIPPRMPRRDYARRVRRMHRLANEAGKPMPKCGIVATVVPAPTVEAAFQMLDVGGLAAEMTRMGYATPPSGSFEKVDDFDGAVVAGPSETIAEELSKYIELGAEQIVFDLRLRPDDWADCVRLLAADVVPLITGRG